jgi:hypothetical protein
MVARILASRRSPVTETSGVAEGLDSTSGQALAGRVSFVLVIGSACPDDFDFDERTGHRQSRHLHRGVCRQTSGIFPEIHHLGRHQARDVHRAALARVADQEDVHFADVLHGKFGCLRFPGNFV